MGEGEGDKVVCMQLYIHIEPCSCVCGKDFLYLYTGFSKSDCMP